MNSNRVFVMLAALLAIGLVGCLGDDYEPHDAVKQFEIDQALIEKYLEENDITAQQDSIHDIYFVIHQQGTGAKPKFNDTINVDYVGKVMSSGVEFDKGDSVWFRLNTLIGAWQVCLPYLQEGGSMTIYSPSYYAYGTASSNRIPPNAVLIFDLDLNHVGFIEDED